MIDEILDQAEVDAAARRRPSSDAGRFRCWGPVRATRGERPLSAASRVTGLIGGTGQRGASRVFAVGDSSGSTAFHGTVKSGMPCGPTW